MRFYQRKDTYEVLIAQGIREKALELARLTQAFRLNRPRSTATGLLERAGQILRVAAEVVEGKAEVEER